MTDHDSRLTLYRASAELTHEGRTLVGIAMPFEEVARVSDYGGPSYLEMHHRSSFDVTLRNNPEPRPFYMNHGHVYGDSPIGVAHFTRSDSEKSLLFRAFLAQNVRAADEALELTKAGATRAVSAGYQPLQTRRQRMAQGEVRVRMENILKELSLTATGMGQFPGAKVLAVRAADQLAADVTFAEMTDAVHDAIEKKLFGADGAPDGVYVALPAITDSWAVYSVEGGALDKPELNDYWRFDYVVGADGAVTVSDNPVRVEQIWTPVAGEMMRAQETPSRTRRSRVPPPLAY